MSDERREDRTNDLSVSLVRGDLLFRLQSRIGLIPSQGPVIPGCISQGRTREEALANIQEAIELCLETRVTSGWRAADARR